MRRYSGFTLVEMLIALAVLSTALALSYGAITNGVRGQGQQEVTVASQAKLRRVTEVVAQDVRGAVFGGLSNSPYMTGNQAISLTLLSGGAGYQVAADSTGSLAGTNIDIISSVGAADVAAFKAQFENSQAMLINNTGNAVIIDTTSIESSDSFNWDLTLPATCSNMIDYTANTLLFNITTLGLKYDADTNTLNQKIATEDEETPLAFDISDFRLEYVYQSDNGALIETKLTPHQMTGSSAPAKSYKSGDDVYDLVRVKMKMEASTEIGGRTTTRSFTGNVELTNNQILKISEVKSCN